MHPCHPEVLEGRQHKGPVLANLSRYVLSLFKGKMSEGQKGLTGANVVLRFPPCCSEAEIPSFAGRRGVRLEGKQEVFVFKS